MILVGLHFHKDELHESIYHTRITSYSLHDRSLIVSLNRSILLCNLQQTPHASFSKVFHAVPSCNQSEQFGTFMISNQKVFLRKLCDIYLYPRI